MKNAIVLLLNEAMTELQNSNELPRDLVVEIHVDSSKDPKFGRYTSNLSLVLARLCREPPLKLAEKLVETLVEPPYIEKIEIGGAGFINFFISPNARALIIADVLERGRSFGFSSIKKEIDTNYFYISPDPHSVGLESIENPVYWIQYAHARVCSVLRQLKERGILREPSVGLQSLDLLEHEHEKVLIDSICRYSEVIEAAIITCEPQRFAYFLKELATRLHNYYNGVELLCEHKHTREARLCLLEAVRQVLNNGLNLLGIPSPESM